MDAGTGTQTKTIVIVVWVAVAVFWVVPSILINLYSFGGIDFPSDRIGFAYLVGGFAIFYGSMLLAPIVAFALVRANDIGYPVLAVVLAVPVAIQALAVVLYIVLADRYGAVCC